MTTTEASFDRHLYHEHIPRLWSHSVRKFYRFLRFHVLFNCLFLLIGGVEIALFLSSFAMLGNSSVLAFILALFFLTLFSYFVLRLYLQAKKPEYLMDLAEEFLNRCKEDIHYQEGIPEHHIAVANAAQKFAVNLHEKEYSLYNPPFFLKSLSETLEKFSAFSHWRDFFRFKEILLMSAVDEHLKVVKCEPTNLEVHAALANAYVMLSSLYADPRKYQSYDEEQWISPERYAEGMQSKFRTMAQRAIEEFKILNDYAPEDPWVHVQLAYSYHDLQMPEEEIKEYEIVLHLRPNDKDTLFKLGMLYFQQGLNAKGLHVYEQLKKTHYKKAESLIKFYGTYDLN